LATFDRARLPDWQIEEEDVRMDGWERRKASRYGASPLAKHDRAVSTAAALLLLEFSREAINFELRRQHGYSEGEAASVIREASAQAPRPVPVRQLRRRRR